MIGIVGSFLPLRLMVITETYRERTNERNLPVQVNSSSAPAKQRNRLKEEHSSSSFEPEPPPPFFFFFFFLHSAIEIHPLDDDENAPLTRYNIII